MRALVFVSKNMITISMAIVASILDCQRGTFRNSSGPAQTMMMIGIVLIIVPCCPQEPFASDGEVCGLDGATDTE